MKNLFIIFSFIFPMCVLSQTIQTGADQTEKYLPLLKDKSIAIVGNQTSEIDGTHLVDSLLALGVTIKKVFAPEHGFRGNADAGEKVKNGVDTKTNIPIISLYGSHKKPTSGDLQGIDLVVFDIQDVGARFYTYISTLHYAMEACAENNVSVLILDRPNPNIHIVDGPVLDSNYKSFIGMHPIPVLHGMTIAEYGKMINGEKWLSNNLNCKLEIVKCTNYTRDSSYNLPVPPSPNLPNMSSIYLYPSLCFFEGTIVSVGRGTKTPFQHFGHPDYTLNTYTFTPKPMYGSKNPKLNGQKCRGENLKNYGYQQMKSDGQLNLTWLIDTYKNLNRKDFFKKNGFFNLLAGTNKLRKQIEAGKSASEIRASWQEDLEKFKTMREGYLLYE